MACRIVSCDEMACFIKNGDMIVVDTRPSTIFNRYHIEKSMPYKEFRNFIHNKNDISGRKIVFVCTRGHKSLRLGSVFSRKYGIDTYSLEDGLSDFMRKYPDLVLTVSDSI
jgi:rhodanese-related sulfurtransferase